MILLVKQERYIVGTCYQEMNKQTSLLGRLNRPRPAAEMEQGHSWS